MASEDRGQGNRSDVRASALFDGPGEVRALCRALDWSATSLGPVEQWPYALQTLVRTCLECPFPISLWCGPEYLLIYNDAYRQALGSKHPHALGRPGAEVWAEIWEQLSPLFQSIRTGGASVYDKDALFTIQREQERTDAWFTFSLSPVRDDEGTIIAFLNIVSETTRWILAERRLEAARQEAEQAAARFRKVFAQAPAFVSVMRGPEHIFEFVNDAYLELVGHRDIIGKPAAVALPEVPAQGFIELIDRVLETGEPYVGREVPVYLARGPGGAVELRYRDFVYQPLTDADGNRTGVVSHGFDVTDQVRARQEVEQLLDESEAARAALAESEARFRAVQDASPDASILTRAVRDERGRIRDFTITYANAATQALLLGGLEDIVGRGIRDVLPGLTEAGRFSIFTHIVETGHAWQQDVHYTRGAVTRDLRLTGVKVGDGVHIGAVDFTERLRAAAEREYLLKAERAARAAAERAQAVAERAQEAADRANLAKGEFLATMSHEFRTPLNAITGYTELLELGVAGPLTAQQRDYLTRLNASRQHLMGLVNDVLDMAKLDALQVVVSQDENFAEREVDTALSLVRPQAESRGIRLINACRPSDLPASARYVGDEHRVRQILLNLLSNAIKFTPPEGTIAVECDTADVPPPGVRLVGNGPWACIAVRDTGIGIAPERQAAVFDPFVQADASHTRTHGGTGLGLTISRRLARLMGGDLTLESTPGVGTTFTLWLPAPGGSGLGRTTNGQQSGVRNNGVGASQEEQPSGDGTSPNVLRLDDVARYLRPHLEELLEAQTARLRADETTGPGSRGRSRIELEDHVLAFISDLIQSLAILGASDTIEPLLMEDASDVQRLIAERHGRQRHRLGWTEAQLDREYQLLRETLEEWVRQRVPATAGDLNTALSALMNLVARGAEAATRGFRRADAD